MQNPKWTLGLGAIIGLLGVILGAMGAHALESKLTTDQLNAYETAVTYQMYHASLLLILSILQRNQSHKLLRWSVLLTLSGILLFSGSIYLLVLTAIPVGFITPIGGVCLIGAWALLFVYSFRSSKS